MKIKKEYFILVFILLIGTIVRIIKFGDTVVGTDVAVFSRLGKNFIESGNYTFGENYNMGIFFPPGYPLFIEAINLFAHDMFFSAVLVSVISSVITIFLFYLIGRELCNEEAGLFAAFAYAVHPLSIIVGVYGNPDALFFCFFFLAIYLFLLSLKKDRIVLFLLIGISAGLATITRPEGMFIFILPVLHFVGVFGNKPRPAGKYIIRVVVMLSVFIMIISPYMLFVKHYTGKFALSGKNNIVVLLAELSQGKDFHEVVNAPRNLYDVEAFKLTGDKTQLSGWNRNVQRSLLRDYILKDPVRFIVGYANNVLLEIKVLFKLFLPFMLPLMFLFFSRDVFKLRTGLIFVLFPIMYFFMYPFFIIIERHTFFIVLFPLILSSIGFVYSGSAITNLTGFCGVEKNVVAAFVKKYIKLLIIAIFIISSFIYIKFSSLDKIPELVEHVKLGNFIKNTYSMEYEKINIMSRKPVVSFYSDARFTMLPYANERDVVDFAKLYNVDFIVVDERLLSRWDYYDELLQLDKHFDDIELVYEDLSDKKIKLFEIRK